MSNKTRSERQNAAAEIARAARRENQESKRAEREEAGTKRAKHVMELIGKLGWLRFEASRQLSVSVNAPYRWAKRAAGEPGGHVPSLLVERYLELLVRNKASDNADAPKVVTP